MYCHAIVNISCPKFSLPTSAGLFGCTGQDPHKLVLVHPRNLTWCNGKSPMLKMSSVFSSPSELTISFTLLLQRRRKKIRKSRETWPWLLKGPLRNLKDEDRENGKQGHVLFISVSKQLLLQFCPWERLSEIIRGEQKEREQQNTNK